MRAFLHTGAQEIIKKPLPLAVAGKQRLVVLQVSRDFLITENVLDFSIRFVYACCRSLAHNGLALGEEANFEALNFQPSTKVDTR